VHLVQFRGRGSKAQQRSPKGYMKTTNTLPIYPVLLTKRKKSIPNAPIFVLKGYHGLFTGDLFTGEIIITGDYELIPIPGYCNIGS
jgi:hypothetical protein